MRSSQHIYMRTLKPLCNVCHLPRCGISWEFTGRGQDFSSFIDIHVFPDVKSIQSEYLRVNFFARPTLALRSASITGYLGTLGSSPYGFRFYGVSPSSQRKSRINKAAKVSSSGDKTGVNEVTEFFRKAHQITKVRDILAKNNWSAGTIGLLKKLGLDFDTFVVAQVLKSGIPAETAFDFFNWLKSLERFSHNIYTYRSVIGTLADGGRLDNMKVLMEEFCKGSSGSTLSLANILQYYGRANNLEGALTVWNQMKRCDGKPSTESYNILIDLLAHERRYQESASMYLEMVQEGCLPNARTYTVLIKHLTELNKLDTALELFKRIPQLKVQSTVRQFSILITAFAKIGNIDVVKLLINRLREEGRRPGRQVHVIQALKTAGKLGEADLIASYYGKEFATQQTVDGLDMYEDHGVYGETDDEAQQVYSPKASTIAWLNPNALAAVIRTWTLSTEIALKEAKVAWNSVLVEEILRSLKKIETAWNFFCWVKDQPGFKHDTYTFSVMIMRFAVEGDDRAVDFLLEQSQREGVQIGIGTINSVIKVHGTARKWVAALEVFRKIESLGQKPNMLTYSTMIHSLAMSRNCTKALEILSEMQQAGYQPDVETYAVLMQQFGLAGNVKMAHLVFTWMFQSGITPNAHAYNTLMDAYCRAGDIEAALKLRKEMNIIGVTPTAAIQSLLLRRCLRDLKYREILDLHKEYFPKVSPGGIRKAGTEDLMWVYNLYSSNLPESRTAD